MRDTAFELLDSMVGTRAWRPGVAVDMSFGAPVTVTTASGDGDA